MEAVRRNQRERLFAALVASVDEKGYERTRVEDLVRLSGVSRRDFYKHFTNKQDCLAGAVEALTIAAAEMLKEAGRVATDRGEGPEAAARAALNKLLELILAQPAAARLCFCEIYAGGVEALQAVDRSLEVFEDILIELLVAMPDHEAMPPRMVRAILGGYQKVIQTRLYRGEESELPKLGPQLFEWGTSYLPPPQPLRQPRRRRSAPTGGRREDDDPAERVMRALAAVVAEKGYPRTTVAGIVERASTSQRTFYEHFDGREEAMMAAFDRGSSNMLSAILPAFRRARNWPEAVRLGLEAMFGFAAREPEYALLGVVGAYAVGKPALEQRDQVMTGLEGLLQPGYDVAPQAPAIAAEAIGGAIYALTYDQLKEAGSGSLAAAAPLATYMALAPFLGAKQACEVANGESP